jgi:ABC-type spermidine/putrescine transport system permease subunit II
VIDVCHDGYVADVLAGRHCEQSIDDRGLWPSIFASAAIIFAFALDDFVIVNQLSQDAATQTVSITIYGAARTSPTPAMNAIGTLMLTASTILIVIAWVVYRRSARRRGDAPMAAA